MPKDVVVGSRRAVHLGTSVAKHSFLDEEMIKGVFRGSDSSLGRVSARDGLICLKDDVEII
jgi:hypothetical protein